MIIAETSITFYRIDSLKGYIQMMIIAERSFTLYGIDTPETI